MQAETSGHGYSAKREIRGLSDLLDKTGNIKFVAAEAAQNTLTTAQEFNWGDVFMRFNYQNKRGKLLANGRSIEEINDINEIGGYRMGRVINALNQMNADRNIDEAIVVSEDLGYGRHFIYRYRRGEDENIEGLAFEFQGTAEELGQVVSQLGKRAIDQSGDNTNDTADFSRPLFFRGENINDITDLSQAASNSFKTPERRRQMDSYLKRLKRDTDGYEELEHRRYQQEKELQKQYEKLILENENVKTGIASAVYGMIKATEKMVSSEDRRRLAAVSGLIDHTGRLIVQNYLVRTKSETDEITRNNKTEESEIHTADQIIQQVIEPVIPAIFVFLPLLSTLSEEKPADAEVENRQHVSASDDTDNVADNLESYSKQEMLWQEFVSAIFQPIENKESEDSEEFFPEELSVSAAELQQGFGVIASLVKSEKKIGSIVVQEEEKTSQLKVEIGVAKTAEEIIHITFQDRQLPQHEYFMQLAFLLYVYNEHNSSEEVKQLVAALIYRQIEIIHEDTVLVSRFPQLKVVFEQFQKLSLQAKFLEDRMSTLLTFIGKLYSEDIIFRGIEDDQELLTKMIFLIAQIMQFTVNEDIEKEMTKHFSIEKLSAVDSYNISKLKYQLKKGRKKLANQGIIYFYTSLTQVCIGIYPHYLYLRTHDTCFIE